MANQYQRVEIMGYESVGGVYEPIYATADNELKTYDPKVFDEVDGVMTDTAAILEDTGTTIPATLTDIEGTGFTADTHSLINLYDEHVLIANFTDNFNGELTHATYWTDATNGGSVDLAEEDDENITLKLSSGASDGQYARAVGVFPYSYRAKLTCEFKLSSHVENYTSFQVGLRNLTDTAKYAHIAQVDGSWFLKTKDGTTEESTAITGPANGVWGIFKLELTSGSVKAYYNGTLQATHTTNVPGVPLVGYMNAAKSGPGSNPRIHYFDWFIIKQWHD